LEYNPIKLDIIGATNKLAQKFNVRYIILNGRLRTTHILFGKANFKNHPTTWQGLGVFKHMHRDNSNNILRITMYVHNVPILYGT